ncbi:MAG: valine--tRNA ligase [Myxococcota bacterium]
MELPKQYNAQEVEAKWRSHWQSADLYRWDSSRGRHETFVVDSPPPTASGSLHMGHIFSYSHQDINVRYRRMKGMNIFYPMGWDDNGLPTERRVQNYLNVRCDPYLPYAPGFRPKNLKKEAPEVISRQNFIELCAEVTAHDEQAYKDLFQRVALSVDWSLEYATIDTHCRKTSQLSFLKLFEEGYAYSVYAPTQWDVDFQTAVAQAEIEDRPTPGAFHHIRFGVEGGGSFVIATTRPELLPACVAVVAHPDDARYQPLFGKNAITPLFRVPVKILPDERANPEKGTGILMVCTFGDATDVEWWRQYKLPLRQIIGKNGRLMPIEFGAEGWESLDPANANAFYASVSGKNTKQAKAAIVELLSKADGEALPGLGTALVEPPKPLEHAVKYYEKGDRPLEIIPTRQWFIKLLEHKEALIEQGRKIEWHPSFMGQRYENWVQGLQLDWCISRQRYFGVPFPVWYKLDALGQPDYAHPILPTADMLPVDPLGQPAPGYDESQRGQPNGFMGDPDVMDTWATSSLTPQIESHWAIDGQRHDKLFPMDLRPQSHEIIRTWAFYTIAKAFFHHHEVPWHHVIISGWILDPDRKKMSKSAGNVVTPIGVLEQNSADAVRYWTARARLGVDTAYDETVFGNGRRLVTKLFNAARFVLGTFKEVTLDSLSVEQVSHPLDRAFLAGLQKVIRRATESLEVFEFAGALQVIEEFFWAELCDNYLEMVKLRAYEAEATPGRLSALATLKLSLSAILRLFAPFVPYITEELWSHSFAGPERLASVHTSPWPTEAELGSESAATLPYELAVEVLKAVRKAKGDAKVSMKTPLASLEVVAEAERLAALEASRVDLCAVTGARALVLRAGAAPDGALLGVQVVLELAESQA